MVPMVDLGTYGFKILNTGEITLEELLTTSSAEKYELELLHTFTIKLHLILDGKYKKENLNRAMKNQWQNIIETKFNDLLKL